MMIEKKVTEKLQVLKPILESHEGVHLTAYLVNRGDLIDLKGQVRTVIEKTHQGLNDVLSFDERKKFLEPVEALLHDARLFKNIKGNIGLFRTRSAFRIISLPIEVEKSCFLASSFHVKPLLKWMQIDRDFLILGIADNSADLYLGNQTSFTKVDSILFPDSFRRVDELGDYASLKRAREIRRRKNEAFTWIGEWLETITLRATPKLFLAGQKNLLKDLEKALKYKNLAKTPLAEVYRESDISSLCQKARKIITFEARATLENALMEFRFAEEINLAQKNIFQIAKAAVKGRVRKLIVADEIHIFGKLDKNTGGLAVHPFELDHEDDDILDDLAQTVLARGGEVVVASRDEIPKGRPALAILEPSERNFDVAPDFNLLQERTSL